MATNLSKMWLELTATIESRDSSIMWSRYIRKKVHLQFRNANEQQTY